MMAYLLVILIILAGLYFGIICCRRAYKISKQGFIEGRRKPVDYYYDRQNSPIRFYILVIAYAIFGIIMTTLFLGLGLGALRNLLRL